jgi:hypothetical protein
MRSSSVTAIVGTQRMGAVPYRHLTTHIGLGCQQKTAEHLSALGSSEVI